MCGIAGLLAPDLPAAELRKAAAAMTGALAHRGPDADGLWLDEQAGLALGHRRLAIIDLSPLGQQPMPSADGRFVIVFNGEIYNYRSLRQELENLGARFRSQSDTEVLLAGCQQWGVAETLRRAAGMFAIALWDRQDRSLTLARDRLGIKPLYWGQQGRLFFFGSELKALRACPGWQPQINPDVLGTYLNLGYIPAPASIYTGIEKLQPGHLLTLKGDGSLQQACFWSALDHLSPTDATPDRLENLLKQVIGEHMLSDVPLGCFLSGGIDSSAVAALMQAQSPRPVRTFSIGFAETTHDESPYARAVAQHLGTDHTELKVTAQDALGTIPGLPVHYDEPFADSSQIPTLLLCRLTRQHVTVALSGDGGDELFAGYDRYHRALRLWPCLRHVPVQLRPSLGRIMQQVPMHLWDRLFGRLLTGDRLARLGDLVSRSRTPDHFYHELISLWPGQPGPQPPVQDWLLRMQLTDLTGYLPDDILTKVDRASMAVALEARVPLLDHRVVEYALGLPVAAKYAHGHGKILLRQVLARHVPDHLIDRPKMGFALPLADWLRGPLRDWASDLLATPDPRLPLAPALLQDTWRQHLQGRNWSHRLWAVLMLQGWLREERAVSRHTAAA